MNKKLIGHVGVDSGQLLLTDPCYIDSEWKPEPFDDCRRYLHLSTKTELYYGKDFATYEQLIHPFAKTMNSMIANKECVELACPDAKENFSYNACCKATLSKEGSGVLNYALGHPGVGVAFTTQIGDGGFPVYGVYNKQGDLMRVQVEFISR